MTGEAAELAQMLARRPTLQSSREATAVVRAETGQPKEAREEIKALAISRRKHKDRIGSTMATLLQLYTSISIRRPLF